MKPATVPALAFAAAALAAPAGANDSTATLAAGGLVLTRTDAIAMRAEDLFLSQKQVRVRYRFANTTAADVTTTVAFPLPDLAADPDGAVDLPIDPEGPANFVAFATTVDGRPAPAQVEFKAVLGAADHTARLKALGVPLSPLREATGRALDRLPKAQQDQLIRLGLAQASPDDAGSGGPRHLAPLWTLKTTYFWRQTFPAGREVVVEHRYRPVVGVWVDNHWSGETPTDPDMLRAQARERADYCVDDGFVASARAAGRRRPPHLALPRLRAGHRRELEGPDRRLPPDRRQGRGRQPRQLLRRRREEDRPHHLRSPPHGLHPDPGRRRPDPLPQRGLAAVPSPNLSRERERDFDASAWLGSARSS